MENFQGFTALFRGAQWLLARPRYLVLGLLPAVVAGLLLSAGLVGLFFLSGSLASWAESSADGLWDWVASGIGIAVRLAVLAGGAVLAYTLFAALSLAIGDPIYSKIAEKIESENGHSPNELPWYVGLRDGLRLVFKGALIGLLAFVLSFIPVIGPLLAFFIAWVITPLILAEELLGRTMEIRGMNGDARSKLVLQDKWTAWSFGALSQLLFTVPLLAVVVMPATVAGAALLAADLMGPKDGESLA